MLNQEIYSIDPSTRKLVNEGVANVNIYNQEVYQYELSTFVCNGQYEKGLDHILSTYLSNLGKPQQPGVWVSGFYGSGKSHLVKMLAALWTDMKFDDGTSARGIAKVPDSIKASLLELSIQGKKAGGLHAASGTLGSRSTTSVRLALLQIIFASKGLPEQYPIARFVMWLKREKLLEPVISWMDERDLDFYYEVKNLHVAEDLHEALVNLKPTLFPSAQDCVRTLNNMFPIVQDVSNNEMIDTIIEALSNKNQFPLTLIVLDEVQQYISNDGRRSMDVQEVVEACCKDHIIGGKLLFVATGQSAVTGTENIKKLEGRFTVRVELSDTDVDAVVRQVVLAKKATANSSIEEVMKRYQGELSRHLVGTSLHHTQKDLEYFVADYPILPVRRRFWEHALRILDGSGTDSQLRNQLSMIHQAVQTNLDKPLGNIIPADYLYFDLADKLLQARILPRNVYEKTMSWYQSSSEERLTARACALVFLINYVSQRFKDIGIKATVDVLADLMVDDLSAGSSQLRSELPSLLNNCEIILKTGDSYAIQTEESSAWQDEYLSQTRSLASTQAIIDEARETKLKASVEITIGKQTIMQGVSKESRSAFLIYGSNLPPDADKNLYIWVRNGWSVTEDTVKADARAAGNQSPTIFVFIAKKSADDIRNNIIEFKAAGATLINRGTNVDTPEWREAKTAMEMRKQTASFTLDSLTKDVLSNAKVYQAGGNEISGDSLKDMILTGLRNAVTRLYRNFEDSDRSGWDNVYSQAKQGAPDALKKIGYEGEPEQHPVCKSILSYIGAGKKGIDIRSNFAAPPYGWSGDAIDGSLQVLLVSGALCITDEYGKNPEIIALDRKMLGKCIFRVESVTVTVKQRIQIRALFMKVSLHADPNKELLAVPQFLQEMSKLTENASGDAPLPEPSRIPLLDEIRVTSGNERLHLIYNNFTTLSLIIEQLRVTANKINERKPVWDKFVQLRDYTMEMPELHELLKQGQAIENQRLLLSDPDPVVLLHQQWEDLVRIKLSQFAKDFSKNYTRHMDNLLKDEFWLLLTSVQKEVLILEHNINPINDIQFGSYNEIIQSIKKYPPESWSDRIDALSQRFHDIRSHAAKIFEPESQTVNIPMRTLKTQDDIDNWLSEMKAALESVIDLGPIVLK